MADGNQAGTATPTYWEFRPLRNHSGCLLCSLSTISETEKVGIYWVNLSCGKARSDPTQIYWPELPHLAVFRYWLVLPLTLRVWTWLSGTNSFLLRLGQGKQPGMVALALQAEVDFPFCPFCRPISQPEMSHSGLSGEKKDAWICLAVSLVYLILIFVCGVR